MAFNDCIRFELRHVRLLPSKFAVAEHAKVSISKWQLSGFSIRPSLTPSISSQASRTLSVVAFSVA